MDSGANKSFEFSAPKFVDFDDMNEQAMSDGDGDAADTWFEGRRSSRPHSIPALAEMPPANVSFEEPSSSAMDPTMAADMEQAQPAEPEEFPVAAATGGKKRAKSSGDDAVSTAAPQSKRPKLTIPKSPQFRYVARAAADKGQGPDSQAALVERIKNRAQDRKMINATVHNTLKKALRKKQQDIARQKPAVTEPIEFKFQTQERIKARHMQQSTAAAMPEPKKPQTRREKHIQEQVFLKLTSPKPFRFRCEERLEARKQQEQQQQGGSSGGEQVPFVEMARLVQMYQTKTPKRFRTKVAPVEHRHEEPLRLTEPVEFHFHSSERVGRPTDYEGREKEVEKEMQAMPKFKALPVNQKILHSAGDLGVPRVPKRPLTEPVSPKFHTDERSAKIREREARDLPQEEHFVFKARPLAEHVLPATASSSAPVEKKPLTVPESPLLMTKARFDLKPKPEAADNQETDASHEFHARPLPVFEHVFQPAKSTKPLTVPQAPHLVSDDRGEKYRKDFEEAVKEMQDEEQRQREFHARPIMTHAGAFPAEEVKIQLTEPQPFHLASEDRHLQFQQMFQQKKEQEKEVEEEQRLFHARSLPKTHEKPFIPKLEPTPLVEVKEFDLNTARRAEERRAFDDHVKAMETQAEAARKKREEEEKQAEEAEVAKLRKEAEFKAQPIRKYRGVEVKQSDKQLTVPVTPQMIRRQRGASLTAPADDAVDKVESARTDDGSGKSLRA